jgi:cytoskeletal protein RodZ
MLRIFSTHGLFGFLLIGLMITSCGGNTSSNTPSTGTSSKTSSGGGTGTTPVTPITSNTTPQPERNDYTSQCNAKDAACISTQSSKWLQDLAQWRQGSTNGSSGGTTGTNPIIPVTRQNSEDTYNDCVRSGYPNCDLDLRGVP